MEQNNKHILTAKHMPNGYKWLQKGSHIISPYMWNVEKNINIGKDCLDTRRKCRL